VLSRSLRGGPRPGAATALGAGAGYLVVLGSGTLLMQALARGPRVAVPVGADVPVPVPARPGGGWSPAFAVGFLSDLLNPKIGMFYVAVVPQFVPAGRPALEYSLLLCGIDVAIALSWLLALTRLASPAVSWLRRPLAARWVPRLCSAAFIGLGASVALGF
jgi:threonine/homoserine/homoserine lactone efflux protein